MREWWNTNITRFSRDCGVFILLVLSNTDFYRGFWLNGVNFKEALAADQVYNSDNNLCKLMTSILLLIKKSLWEDQQVLVPEPWIDMAVIQDTSLKTQFFLFHFAINKLGNDSEPKYAIYHVYLKE